MSNNFKELNSPSLITDEIMRQFKIAGLFHNLESAGEATAHDIASLDKALKEVERLQKMRNDMEVLSNKNYYNLVRSIL